jgi:hypothetical protein
MDKYQKAAKTLNEIAPQQPGLPKERIAFLNPIEEEILKSIGGSGAVIVPEASEKSKKAGDADTEVPSYLFKWFKKTVLDDWLGIDDNKTFGIKHHTFLGKGLGKVRDDILGIDSTKTFGISDATWEDLLPWVASAINPIAGFAYAAADAVAENNWEGSDYNNAKRAIRAQQEAAREAASKRAGNMTEDELANSRALAMDLISRGKSGLIDPSDSARLQTLLASPGDEAYIEGESIGGMDVDPFPNRFRESGDFINRTLNNTGRFAEDYIGTEDQRMNDFAPILDRMKGMNLDAMRTLGSIYDQGPGGLESQYRGFQDDFNRLSDDQKRLNMMTADSNQGFVNDVIAGGDRYADAIRGAKDLQTGLTNQAFDELSALEGIKLMENQERMGRFADTRMAEIGRNAELEGRFGDTRDALRNVLNEEESRFYDSLNSRLSGADRLGDARLGRAGSLRDAQMEGAQGLLDSRMEGAQGLLDSRMGAADRLRDAERLKAISAADSVERAANARQRNLASANVGQGTGTNMNMANAMIGARLGADRSDIYADAQIGDARRRGDAEMEFADTKGRAGTEFADTIGRSGTEFADNAGRAEIGRATDKNRAEDLFARSMEGNIKSAADLEMMNKLENVLDRDADIRFSNKMERVLDSDASRLGAEIGADRYKTLAELDPGSGEVMGSQADLQNRMRALGYGDQMLNAFGANIGIDQSTLDDERRLLSDLTNMRLGNTSMIPSMGMQYAQLPATMLESALAPMGPLVRNISPYTSTGQLTSPITSFSPIAPPEQKMEWYDYAMMAPQIGQGFNQIRGAFS